MIPKTYEEWFTCITKDCGIDLTENFITTRIQVLEDNTHTEAIQFSKLYGDTHRLNVISWLKQAQLAR